MDTAQTFRAADGTTLAYRIARAARSPAPLLVMIHGVASNLTRWSEFVERTKLRGSWDLLRLDLRGHGGSFTRKGLHIASWVDDLSALLDHEQHGSAVFAGHSLGAQVAVQFAARHPSRARALVLIDPVFRQALRGGLRRAAACAPLLRTAAAALRGLNAIGIRRRHIPQRDLRALDERARKQWLSASRGGDMVAHYGSLLEDLRYFPLASYLADVLAMTEPLPAPESLAMPALALLSSGITYTEPRLTRELLSRLPHGRIIAVDAYHWPLTERPDEVRAAIDSWCAALAAQAPRPAAP
jgi:esterase